MKKLYTFLLKSKFLAAVSILSFLMAGCSSTNESETEQLASPAPTKVQLDSVAQKTIRDAVDAYLGYDCKPKYVNNEIAASMGVYLETPSFYGPLVEQVDEAYFVRSDVDNVYGNFATRTLFLNSLFHYKLSGLYFYIFDVYDTEMKSFREGYSSYKRIADKSAKNLCKLVSRNLFNQTLSASDQQKVQVAYDELVTNWSSFKEWYSATTKIGHSISEENDAFVKDLMTPKCNEYPSADGKYVVVKCTVPPG